MEKGVEDWEFRISARKIKLQRLIQQKMNWKQLEFKQEMKLNCSRGSQKNQKENEISGLQRLDSKV